MRGFVNRMLLKTIDQMFIDKRFQMRFNIYPLSNQSRNPPKPLLQRGRCFTNSLFRVEAAVGIQPLK